MMAEYIIKGDPGAEGHDGRVTADNVMSIPEREEEKIKTPFLHIVVGGAPEKPCYSILWWDNEAQEFNLGYSSYCLDYVRVWRDKYFEITTEDFPVADVVEVKTLKAWLYQIAMNNVGAPIEDMASACEEIANRLDGLRAFAREEQ